MRRIETGVTDFICHMSQQTKDGLPSAISGLTGELDSMVSDL